MTERNAGAVQQGRSLRATLTSWLLAAVGALWIATALFSFFDARHEVDELLDAHLAQSAALLLTQAASGAGALPDEAELSHRYARRVIYQVWDARGRLLLHSDKAPRQRLSARDQGFSSIEIGDRRWRVFSLRDDDHHLLIQMGEQSGAREAITLGIARNLLWPLAAALPLLGVLVWLIVWRGTAPLGALGQEIARRDPANLEPVTVRRTSVEVAPLVMSLNRLLARVRASLEGERRFTADAAHELRTPIAAVRAQAQVAHAAVDAATRERALDQVIAGCDRAARLVDQLLTLARIDPQEALSRATDVELAAVVRRTLAEMAGPALAQDVEVELDADVSVLVRGDATLIAILLRNLVANALHHAPAGSAVRVQVTRASQPEPGGAELVVTDQGPGVPETLRAHLGERFFRAGAATGDGSGLGLSIVKRIAELHRATVEFADRPGGSGLMVRVRFPTAEQVRAARAPE